MWLRGRNLKEMKNYYYREKNKNRIQKRRETICRKKSESWIKKKDQLRRHRTRIPIRKKMIVGATTTRWSWIGGEKKEGNQIPKRVVATTTIDHRWRRRETPNRKFTVVLPLLHHQSAGSTSTESLLLPLHKRRPSLQLLQENSCCLDSCAEQ